MSQIYNMPPETAAKFIELKEVASRVRSGMSSEVERKAIATFAITILNSYLGIDDANDPINMSSLRLQSDPQGVDGDQVSFGADQGFTSD